MNLLNNKSTSKITLFMLLISFNSYSQENNINKNDFKYYSDINGSIQKNKINSVYLRDDILDKSENDLKDIRIFNGSGNETPFIILDEKTPEDIKEIKNFEITDYSEQSGKDIIIAKLTEKNLSTIESIFFETSNNNFNKKIKIYGSDETQKWDFINENNIYDFSSKINLKKTQINFPKPKTYKYYKFEIQNLTQSEKDSMLRLNYKDLNLSINDYDSNNFRIDAINGETFSKNKEIINYDSKKISFKSENIDKKTVINLNNNIPINKILFDISDPYYYREVNIYQTKNDKFTDNKLILKDVIYDIGSGENNEKKFININNLKNIRIEISNLDNPSLVINKITTQKIKNNLFFISNENNYSLYIGNKDIQAPSYDINNYINQYNWFKTNYNILKLSSVNVNQRFIKGVSKEDNEKFQKNILMGIIFLISGLLAIWIFKMTKEVKK